MRLLKLSTYLFLILVIAKCNKNESYTASESSIKSEYLLLNSEPSNNLYNWKFLNVNDIEDSTSESFYNKYNYDNDLKFTKLDSSFYSLPFYSLKVIMRGDFNSSTFQKERHN